MLRFVFICAVALSLCGCESDADFWNLVIPNRAPRKDGSVGGLHADDSDTRFLLF